MAEEDYDIDFYGDEANEQDQQPADQPNESHDASNDYQEDAQDHGHDEKMDQHQEREDGHQDDGENASRSSMKRKQEDDDRPLDPGATSAVMISELNWWTTDDDIRGWLRQSSSEDEVKDLTFSEHKVNGKSKGQVYVEFFLPQAATAAKRFMDALSADGGQPSQKKIATAYWNPSVNPFKTLPKDATGRVKEQTRSAPSGPYNDRGDRGGYGGYRGRGGYNRGGGMNQNYNRNYNNNNMGYNNMGGGFNNPMGGGGNFGFNNRGGMMGGMRGGPGMRGGRGGNMMGMNPMANMPMGMPGMGMMQGGMPGGMPGFQGMPNFNAGNFGFNQGGGGGGGGGGDWGNPHGAKRPRPE